MSNHHTQLTKNDRICIARLQREGYSIRKIATHLYRAPSTISREIHRNSTKTGGYQPGFAHAWAQKRCDRLSRLEHDAELRKTVMTLLHRGFSPEQIAGRLKLEAGKTLISCQSIYRFVRKQYLRTKDKLWMKLLPHARTRRGRRAKPG